MTEIQAHAPKIWTPPTLIVGEAPSRQMQEAIDAGDENAASYACLHPNLAAIAGIDVKDLYLLFRRANLLQRWPGPSRSGRGDDFDESAGRASALALSRYVKDPHNRVREVVLLGRRVARAFGFGPQTPFFAELIDRGPRLYVAPHPSKVSRWWNKPENVAGAQSFWLAIVADARTAMKDACARPRPGVLSRLTRKRSTT